MSETLPPLNIKGATVKHSGYNGISATVLDKNDELYFLSWADIEKALCKCNYKIIPKKGKQRYHRVEPI